MEHRKVKMFPFGTSMHEIVLIGNMFVLPGEIDVTNRNNGALKCSRRLQPCSRRLHLCSRRLHPCSRRLHLCSRRLQPCSRRLHLCSRRLHLCSRRLHPCSRRLHLFTGEPYLLTFMEQFSRLSPCLLGKVFDRWKMWTRRNGPFRSPLRRNDCR